jgi:uncharacterized BrkB/YihY/UPF0761 family membrane protein
MNEGTKSNLSSTILILLIICILEIISHWVSGSGYSDTNNVFFRFEQVRTLSPVLIFFIVSLIYYWFISDPKDFKKTLLIAILALCIAIKLLQIFFSYEGLGGAGLFLNKVSSYLDMLAQLLRIYVIYKILQISDR